MDLRSIWRAKRKPVEGLDDRGREIPDPTPMSPPLGYKKEPSLREQIRQMILSEKLRQEVEAAGFETMEEADDFDVGDDFDPRSGYENDFDPPATAIPDVRPEVAEAEKRAVGGADGDPQESEEAPPNPRPRGKKSPPVDPERPEGGPRA